MPFTTVVAGTVITASWGNMVRDQLVTPFANAATRTAQVTVPVEGMLSWLNDVNRMEAYNGAQWVTMHHPFSATVATSQTTTSTSFTNLATPGPAVTLNTGTSALITLSGKIKCSAADQVLMGCAVSGASTIAAAATQALTVVGTSEIGASYTYLVSGLTAGSNTFTAQYRIAFSGTMTAADRVITVVPLP